MARGYSPGYSPAYGRDALTGGLFVAPDRCRSRTTTARVVSVQAMGEPRSRTTTTRPRVTINP